MANFTVTTSAVFLPTIWANETVRATENALVAAGLVKRYDFLVKSRGQTIDIPNISKRNRFFSSESGVKFHQQFTQTNSQPEIELFQLEFDKIDDGIVIGILQRYRGFGFESYLLPQGSGLPLSNRREDILIIRN